MKRFTLLVASLFMVLGAMAQTAVTDLSELSNDKKYFIESARCFLMYKPAVSDSKLCTSNASGEAVERKMAVEAHQFNIISENGSYYLYSIGAGKYVSKDGSFVETKSDALTLENVGGNYPWKLCIGGNGLNSQIPGQLTEGIVVNSWTNADAGNCYQIIDIPADYVDPVYVTSPADITSTALYTIAPNDASRGVLFANSTSSYLTTTALANQDVNDVNQQFMFITKEDKTYLYSVGANKFVNDEGKYLNLTAAAKDYVVVESADVDGHLFIKMNGSDLINVSTGWAYGALADWNTADNGNRLRVRYVDEASEDLLAAVDELFNTTANVTYNFVCNGVTLATQTATVSKGEAYPKFNVTLPLGYSLPAIPEGTVTATVTKDIAVTVDNSLLPFEAVAEGTPTTWYYAQMHAHPSYHWFVAPAEDGSIATAGHKFAASEVEAHLWGFVGTVEGGFKMVNKATGEAIKSTNSGLAEMAAIADATSFIAMGSKAGVKYFCLRYPEANNYLNSQSNVIKHWGDNDNGSSFLLTEYVDEDVTVNVSEAGWATKYFAESVHVPAGVNAYIITGAADGYVTKEQIAEGEVIPANTGILLENAGEHSFAKTVSYDYTLAGNLMNGSVENTYVEGEAYVLANGENGVGMYLAKLNKDAEGNEGTTHFLNNAGKAYLVLPATSEAVAFYGFDWAGTTAIENVEVESSVKAIYDLTGRKVEAITAPGIYIVNGVKRVVR